MSVKRKKKSTIQGVILISKIPLRLTAEQQLLVDQLRVEAANLWNDILELHWWLYDVYKIWTDAVEKKRWINGTTHKLHSQTIQAIIELHEETCLRTKELRDAGNTDWKYPWKHKRYFILKYKKSALSLKDDKTIRLSNGRNKEALEIPFPNHLDFSKVKSVEIVWKHNRYWIHYAIEKAVQPKVEGNGMAGGDVGEIHAITLSDGKNHQILTGRELRSLNRLRNKRLRWFQRKLSRTQKGSNTRKQLFWKKRRFIAKMERKMEYLLHSISKMAVEWCVHHGVKTLYIGNPNGVQTNTKKTRRVSRKVRQKLSNWSFGWLITLIKYKAKLRGVDVEVIEESYTSGTCPACGVYTKQRKRNYRCSCGATGHRDVIGAVNIMEKGVSKELRGGRDVPQVKDTTYRRVRLHSNRAVA